MHLFILTVMYNSKTYIGCQISLTTDVGHQVSLPTDYMAENDRSSSITDHKIGHQVALSTNYMVESKLLKINC